MAKMTKSKLEQINILSEKKKQLEEEQKKVQKDLEALQFTVYGYARVSTKGQAKDGNSLAAQKAELLKAGAEIVYSDASTGMSVDRPNFNKLHKKLKSGDRLIVTKLDRMARSLQQGVSLIQELSDKGVTVQILNIGTFDDTATGRLIRNIMLSIAEFERDMILQRTREGKEVARTKPGFRDGRPEKFTKEQKDLAFSLLLEGHSYRQVAKMTGISRGTVARIKAERISAISDAVTGDVVSSLF